MRFVETPIFTRVVSALLDDESYRMLQSALMRRPEQGATVGGSGGARKMRWARPGSGKRGGIRIIYYWSGRESAFYMLFAYAKTEQGDLTPKQMRILAALIREEFR